MKITKLFFSFLFILLFLGCASTVKNVGTRILNLDGIEISETELGGAVCYHAVDKYNYDDFFSEKIRFQVGYFKNDNSMGFVLWEDGTEGEMAYFHRQGLYLRWDWGAYTSPVTGEKAYRYTFVIEPDNTGLYYDFSASTDGTSKPRGIYKTHKY